MAKLGYTWYAKDWGSSKRVFRLSLAERGFYRELIDMAYMSDNKIVYEPDLWVRLLNSSEEEINSIIEKLCNLKNSDGIPLIEKKGDYISIPECDKRIKIAQKNRENGAKGGAKKGNQNAKKQPKNNPKTTEDTTQKTKQREREREREREDKSKREMKGNIEVRKKEFSDTLKPFLEKYGKDLLNNFYSYWTQDAQNSKSKMLFEVQKGWSISHRLSTWKKKDYDSPKSQVKSFQEQKQSEADQFYSKFPKN